MYNNHQIKKIIFIFYISKANFKNKDIFNEFNNIFL